MLKQPLERSANPEWDIWLEARPQQPRGSYPTAIEFLANHPPFTVRLDEIAEEPTVKAIAEAFNVHPRKVAGDIVQTRRSWESAEA